MSPRGVYERGPSRAKPKVVRTLRPGEPRPDGEPRRYPDRAGYVRLRWRVGVQEYVEVREHRHLTGAEPEVHVHHRDHNTANNILENLVQLTPEEHSALHADERRKVDVARAADMYQRGASTPEIGRAMGVDGSNVYRNLASLGVLRDIGAAARLRRTVDDERVLDLYRMGLNAVQIARLVKAGPHAVRCALRRQGVGPRRSGRPTRAMCKIEEELRA